MLVSSLFLKARPVFKIVQRILHMVNNLGKYRKSFYTVKTFRHILKTCPSTFCINFDLRKPVCVSLLVHEHTQKVFFFLNVNHLALPIPSLCKVG